MKKPVILIIDSDSHIRNSLTATLTSKGFTVFTAETGAEGLSRIANHPIDLALIDLSLTDGSNILSRIKANSPSTIVIILTNDTMIESALEATKNGAFSYLVKPCKNDQAICHICWALEKGKVEAQAQESEIKFGKLLDAAPDAILILNEKEEILIVNNQFEEMFGYNRSEVVEKNLATLIPSRFSHHAEYAREYVSNPQKRLMGNGREFFALRKDGTEFSAEISLSPLKTIGGLLIIALIRDITERLSCEVRLEHQANHDGLTELPNRNLLIDRLNQALLYAERYHQNVAVLFIDLDHFKIINNSLGHFWGDQLLKKIAKRFSGCIRASDTVARQGGDDFVFVVQDFSKTEDIVVVAQKILTAASQPMKLNNHNLEITCSIGISIYPKDGKDSQTLLKNADAAMFRAKERGRNAYHFFTYQLNDKVVARMNMEMQLRQALKNNELSLCYQPQLSLVTGQMIGVEALLRWKNPELGIVSPAELIPLAEETGLIIPFGEWVLWTACAQNSEWQKRGLPTLTMAVNLSPRQFWDPGLIRTITEILRKTGLDPAFLELEIIESMVMRDKDSAISMLQELKEIGVKLSIDDFGTGYSSLNHLRSFPFDKLKMDISFVREITYDPGSAAIAKTIIALAHNLNLQVIAEGVETEAQLSYLRNHGCDEMQGYYFSKPVSAQEFTQLLEEGRHLPVPGDHNSPPVKTLLVLDDEQFIIDAIRRTLRSESYRILSAICPSEGFDQLALNHVDVILCDQKLPEMTGVEFLKRVKDLYPSTIRIAMSGYADADMVANSINQSGIYKFLIKPIDSELLRQTIDQAFLLVSF